MKRTETYTLPAGYGGNMDFSNVQVGEYPVSTEENSEIILVISETSESYLRGYIEHADRLTGINMLHFLMCIDAKKILSNRGVYFK